MPELKKSHLFHFLILGLTRNILYLVRNPLVWVLKKVGG